MDQPPNEFAAGGACRAGSTKSLLFYFPFWFGLVSFPSEKRLFDLCPFACDCEIDATTALFKIMGHFGLL